jgi:prophage regulatory protein
MSRKLPRPHTGRRRHRKSAADAEAARQLSLTLEWTPPSRPAPSAPLPPDPAPRSAMASVPAASQQSEATTQPDRPHSSDTILRLPAVKAATGLCRSVIYERIRKGTFPRPVVLGPKSVGWPASVVSEWVQGTINGPKKARV